MCLPPLPASGQIRGVLFDGPNALRLLVAAQPLSALILALICPYPCSDPSRPCLARAQVIPLQTVVLEDSVVPFKLDPSFRAVAVSHQV